MRTFRWSRRALFAHRRRRELLYVHGNSIRLAERVYIGDWISRESAGARRDCGGTRFVDFEKGAIKPIARKREKYTRLIYEQMKDVILVVYLINGDLLYNVYARIDFRWNNKTRSFGKI